MSDIEVHLDWTLGRHRIGTMRRVASRGGERMSFEYDVDWLASPLRFELDPLLPLTAGPHYPPAGQALFGTLGDSAPDRWGKDLMRRRERRAAERDGRPVRALQPLDFLLGVNDITRLGALRFRFAEAAGQGVPDEESFLAPSSIGVPGLVALGDLVGAADRIARNEESDEDLQLLFVQGSSLGGARPKASVHDAHGRLSIAKFPRHDDDYEVETWEAVALTLAREAGITVADFEHRRLAGRPVLLSRRFDRTVDDGRVPFQSAMSMTGHLDGDGRGSYLHLADVIARSGGRAAADRVELFRRVAFSVLVSNVDDHLRNHGFLRDTAAGWVLSPAYDINPVPGDIKPRILSTAIDETDRTCDIDLVLETAGEYGLARDRAARIVAEIAGSTRRWADVARRFGAPEREIRRMQSAFEHADMEKASGMDR